MGTDKVSNKDVTDDKLNQLILSEYPYPIAVNYKRLLDEQDWEKKTRACIQVFEFGLRAITLGLISQYLIRDTEKVSDPQLNQLLLTRLSRATLGTWNEIFFKALQAYQGKRKLFFMPELYDLYWDTSTSPHRPHKGLHAPFDRLIQIRNDLVHGAPPADEAGWQALFEESFRLLRQVLSHFTFLENYDLIRILWAEGGEYWYDIYTGLQVISPSQPLRTEEDLTEGWFYLSKQEKRFLELHPLLIFWEKELAEADRERMRDAAIFDRFRRTSLDYLATVLREKINLTDQTLIAEFIKVMYYNIEKVKMARREVRKLSWWLLKEVAEKVSSERIGDVRSKYRREVYLQREETKRTFEEFLASDKTCLVLIGKSGVGKSNFFLSLMDEYEDSSEVCTLMYNGARFSAETGVADALARDFELYLKLEGLAKEKGIGDILFEINRIEGIAHKKVVLLIDALNENPDARGLLRRADKLVEANPYPWLKVVISSRPETWRTIKRGVRLAEHKYYREEETRELGVEMQPFSIEVEMKPFARKELPAAYAKYQEVFELQTDYEEVPAEVRQMLRDPLVMWLVAEIHRGRGIPQDIKVSELYQKYVDALIRTGRLYAEDLHFLERELMPLMIREGGYANSITGETISVAKTTDGKSLFELIHSDEVLSSGRRVNQSYANLVDAEILMELETDIDYQIAFKYERFYEFFGGQQLHRAGKDASSQVSFYEGVTSALPNSVFLWGALVQALIIELGEDNVPLLVSLAPKSADNRLLRSSLVEALARFGEADRPKAEKFIWELMGSLTPPPRTVLGALGRLLRPIKDSPTQVLPQKTIAIEAATRLRMTELLEEAAADPSPGLRSAAAQQIFYLWKKDHSASFKVLDGLSHRVTDQYGLPDLGVAESMLAVSGAILGQEHQDPEILTSLLAIGRRTLRRILRLADREQEPSLLGHVRRVFVGFLYDLVVRGILRFALRVMAGWGEHAYASVEGLAHVFELSSEQKQLLQTFIPLLDGDEPGLAERISDMVRVEEWGDQIGQVTVELPIFSHGVTDFDETLSIVKQFTEFALRPSPPRFWIGGPISNLWHSAMRLDNPNPEVLRLMEEVCAAVQEDPERWASQARIDRAVPVSSDTQVAFLCNLIGLAYTLDKEIEVPELVIECLQRAMKADDEEYLRLYIKQELTILFEFGLCEAAVSALKPIVNYDSPRVRETIVEFLVRARNYEPEFVEDVLLQGEFPQEIVTPVLANPTSERLIDLVTWQLLTIIYDLFLLGPQPLKVEFQYLLSKSLELSSLDEWLALVVKELLNLLIGEVVLKVPEDAPSRQLL